MHCGNYTVMSNVTRKCGSFIDLLSTAPHCQVNALLRTASDDQVRCISQIAANVLYGVIPIHHVYKSKLGEYKHVLRDLSDKKKPIASKKQLIVRNSTAIVYLLKSAKTVLNTLVT